MRERWERKEQERFEHFEKKAIKEMEMTKECDRDIYNSDKDQECKEAEKRLYEIAKRELSE